MVKNYICGVSLICCLCSGVESFRTSGVLVTQHLYLFSFFLNIHILPSSCLWWVKPFGWRFFLWRFAWSLVFFWSWMSKSSSELLLSCAHICSYSTREKYSNKMRKCEHDKQILHMNEQSFWCKLNRDSWAANRTVLSQDQTGRMFSIWKLFSGFTFQKVGKLPIIWARCCCRMLLSEMFVCVLSFIYLAGNDLRGSVSSWIPKTVCEAEEGGGCWMFVSGLLLASHLLRDCWNKLLLC